MIKKAPDSWYLIGLAYSFIHFVLLIVFNYVFAASPPSSIWNYIEIFLALLFMPVFMAGFATAGAAQERGGNPLLSHLFSGFRTRTKRLISIGAIMVAWALIIILTSFFFLSKPRESLFLLHLLFVFVSFILSILSWPIIWIASMMVMFQRVNAGVAIRNSLKAFLINWRAMCVFFLTLFAGMIAFTFFQVFLFFYEENYSLYIEDYSVITKIPILLLMPILTSWASLIAYVAYRDIFHAEMPPPP